MKKKTTKYYILALLILVFAAPGIGAYLFFSHPSWLGESRTNKGLLLTEPVKLPLMPGNDKWRIVYWTPINCKKACLNQLDVLARVRLALGRKLYQVDQLLVLGNESRIPASTIAEDLKVKDFRINQLSVRDTKRVKQISEQSKIFIMNPDNYLILSYKSGVNPDDVYKDLKLLINTTESN
jgi:hypothetical protein